MLEVSLSRRLTGILLAHEVGHYLRLEHFTTITNVMGVDSNGDGVGEIGNNSTGLTAAQGTTMSGPLLGQRALLGADHAFDSSCSR